MLDYLRAHALAGTWAGGERIVVAVSELPGAERAGARRQAPRRRAARALDRGPYRDAARRRASATTERERLAATMQLAAQLGAQCRERPGDQCRSRGSSASRRCAGDPAGRRQVGPLALVRAAPRLGGRPAGARDARRRGPCSAASESAARHAPAEPAAPTPPGAWGRPIGYAARGIASRWSRCSASRIYAFGNLTNVALLYLIPVMAAATPLRAAHRRVRRRASRRSPTISSSCRRSTPSPSRTRRIS